VSIQLIIFDCDGVLVDTEHITGSYFQRYLHGEGVTLAHDDAIHRYSGWSLAAAVDDIEALTGKAVPADFIDSFRSETMATMAAELQAIPGVESALQTIETRKCVASNGPINKMQLTLRVTGLARYFEGALFSAYEIEKWKPDPHLFLHAAEQMQVPPEHCLVVEDSIHGIQAAVAAGMQVMGYTPHTQRPAFRQAGARTFRDMGTLPDLIAEL
jgi:HAD superfamily hydrolase (TIGR01509 family)